MDTSVLPFPELSWKDYADLGLSRDRSGSRRNAKKSRNRASAKAAKASRKRNR